MAQNLENTCPPEFLEVLGSYPDFPNQEELRSGYGEDLPREPLDDSTPLQGLQAPESK